MNIIRNHRTAQVVQVVESVSGFLVNLKNGKGWIYLTSKSTAEDAIKFAKTFCNPDVVYSVTSDDQKVEYRVVLNHYNEYCVQSRDDLGWKCVTYFNPSDTAKEQAITYARRTIKPEVLWTNVEI